MEKLLARREAAIESLVGTLGHLTSTEIISILTSFMSLDRLEEVAKFQRERLSDVEMEAITRYNAHLKAARQAPRGKTPRNR